MSPYSIEGPATISFSGGRTSAFMLHQIVDAHGGELPPNVVVLFANTSKEREETLRFVHNCGTHWGVPIVWLEWQRYKPKFRVVGYNSAARPGEVFEALIDTKQRPPNHMQRYCTENLKVKTMMAYAAIELGWSRYTEVIGLRHDEGWRILKGLDRAKTDGRQIAYPLARAKVTKADVMTFWSKQPFDLGLRPWEGNCDLCFLKGRKIRERIIRDDPSTAVWWDKQENTPRGGEGVTGWFDKEVSYAELSEYVERSPLLFEDEPASGDYDVECGLSCAPYREAAE